MHPTFETVSVRMIVDDVDDAIAFWQDHVGLAVDFHPAPGFAMLSRGNLRLLLNRPGAGGAGADADDGSTPMPGGWTRVQVGTDDLDLDVDRLRAAGVTFRTGVIEGAGGRQVVVEDPSRNAVELFEPTDG